MYMRRLSSAHEYSCMTGLAKGSKARCKGWLIQLYVRLIPLHTWSTAVMARTMCRNVIVGNKCSSNCIPGIPVAVCEDGVDELLSVNVVLSVHVV